MADTRSILEKYDTMVATWLVSDFASVFPTLDVQVLVASPDTQYADFVTKKFADVNTLKVPRIAVYRGQHLRDYKRFNGNSIQKFRVTPNGRGYQSAHLPAPINIPYQIGLWTDKVHQMNRWLAKMEWQLRFGYRTPYLSTDVEDGWGVKLIPLFRESILNMSDVEPEAGRPRLVRYDVSLRMEAWIFDQPSVDPDIAPADEGPLVSPAVYEIETDIIDEDTAELLDRSFNPQR